MIFTPSTRARLAVVGCGGADPIHMCIVRSELPGKTWDLFHMLVSCPRLRDERPAMNPEDPVKRQLDAYNAHDLDRFLAQYSE